MSNLPLIILSLETYEERVELAEARLKQKQAETIQKMIELGFSTEEIEAVTLV